VFLGFPISSISPYISLKHTKKALIGAGSEVCESFLTQLSTRREAPERHENQAGINAATKEGFIVCLR
jgi:hypothetical protein